ncbi:tryptophan-rich sensory protein [Legionella taurinensis]|uniref:Tryptophan-rich sensory protein n=1 Tax=Legionella taurinensis TaxID=70611 RepID=A0A3A5L3V6_9GAMM|nr:TspO/MBR family protein [Legionella taurinensis]MDX1838349.1 TspO/MBR family protein [Legionella taurinensis]PUT39112.1 tryptophan-rich sensory protein [Legionella taurinensis]PUT39566.1 tryptophan-rich sensory protein [Legionella taurinensis]PUT43568.1 tryptophan-rich sensory protein [Legionella taurinensis]PUT45222.1 tryptophan-rich sensory protein [Legionella taurinensis]
MKIKKGVQFILWIIAIQGMGFLFGLLTKANISWYEHLNKSSLTPPPWAFPTVWSLLYLLLAIVGWALWTDRKEPRVRPLFYLYLLQLVMNWSWTPFFFQWHWTGFSLLWIILIASLTGIMIYRLYPEKRTLAVLLIPYLVWLAFAAYLNGVIWLSN